MLNIILTLQIYSEAQTCNDCLDNDSFKENFWCVSSQKCMPLSQINDCENVESHDLVLNASQCCSIITSQTECLDPNHLSFCLWCPAYTKDDGTEVAGQCMYKSDPENINKNCLTNPDITSPCSSYGDCATCANDVVCAWCPQMGRCVTAILDDMPYPNEEYKCTGASTKICCDSYTDCVTCAQNSGSASDLICTWCQTSIDGSGICQTYDKALENKDCQAINELGVKYCGDTCYMEGQTCKQCLKHSGCVWLDKIQYTVSDAYPIVDRLCTAGGPKGPSKTTIEYDSVMNITYDFTIIRYNYMTCAMSAASMNALIIGLVVSVVAVAIIIYVIFIVRRKIKISKYMKEQAKKNLTQADRDMLNQKYEECEQEFIEKYLQEIPWED